MNPRLSIAVLKRLRDAKSGVALIEFALILPIFIMISLTGAELLNYIITRMRVSQMALQLADNMARMGEGSQLQAKTISEKDVNDVLTGTGLQSGELDLYNHGRAIVYQIEPMANPNSTDKYKISWQRCRGVRTSRAPSYGIAGQSSGTNQPYYGPSDQPVKTPDSTATMMVEVYYEYTPLVKTSLAPSVTMTETASMMVRDRRDLTQIYNSESAPVSSC